MELGISECGGSLLSIAVLTPETEAASGHVLCAITGYYHQCRHKRGRSIMERTSEQIRQDILNHLAWDSRVDERRVMVEVTEGIVTLSGVVSSHMQRSAAEMDVRSIPGVVKVMNRLKILKLEEDRSSDDQIAWNVKSVLSLNESIEESRIEINVDNGVVIVSGSVDEFWKKVRVEELAYDVPGVLEVINTLSVVPTGTPFDQEIAAEIMAALSRIGSIDLEAINLEVNGGRVVIRGKVPDWYSYSAAHNAVKYTRGVTDLTNNLVIA